MQDSNETIKAHEVANGMGARIVFCKRCGATQRTLHAVTVTGVGPLTFAADWIYGDAYERFIRGYYWCLPCIRAFAFELDGWDWNDTLTQNV